MRPVKAIYVLSIVACATTWIGATDWTVGPSGSGAQFASIQAAINAAQPGDRVFVMPGTYSGAACHRQAIELIGAGSTLTTTTALPVQLPGNFPTPVAISDIPAGSRVRVSGFTFNFVGQTLYTPYTMMTVYNCAGRVELCDIRLPATLPNQPVPFQGGVLPWQIARRSWPRECSASATMPWSHSRFPFPCRGTSSHSRDTTGSSSSIRRSG